MNEFWTWFKDTYEGSDKVFMCDSTAIYARTESGVPSTQVMVYGTPAKPVVSVGSVPVKAYEAVALILDGLARFCKPLYGHTEVTLMGFAAQAIVLLEEKAQHVIADAPQGTVVTASNEPDAKMPRFSSIVRITLKD